MNVNIRITGLLDEILEEAVREGLAKTKSEALRLGVLELNRRYRLLEHEEMAEDIKAIDAAKAAIKSGKVELVGKKEFYKEMGWR